MQCMKKKKKMQTYNMWADYQHVIIICHVAGTVL